MIRGSALKYPADDVNTDVIWPGRYTYVQIAPEEMSEHAMEGFDPEFATKAAKHSVLVVGKNFGCGSSREQASECLKYSGIQAVVAKSFARIFYRNSINIGLPLIESVEASELIQTGDPVEVDLEAGTISVRGRTYSFPQYPPFILQLIRDGGLVNQIRKRLKP